MRVFRIQARTKNNQVVNKRTYIGLEKLRMYARPLWQRYNRYASAELHEFIDGKWVLIPDSEKVRMLINPYHGDPEV